MIDSTNETQTHKIKKSVAGADVELLVSVSQRLHGEEAFMPLPPFASIAQPARSIPSHL
jgi:hypothetical protein